MNREPITLRNLLMERRSKTKKQALKYLLLKISDKMSDDFEFGSDICMMMSDDLQFSLGRK